MNNKLQAKDQINLGLFTVLYFVLGCCVAIPIGFVPIFLPILGALWTLITGIPFMLFLTRVKNRKKYRNKSNRNCHTTSEYKIKDCEKSQINQVLRL